MTGGADVTPPAPRFLPLLLVLFVGSGCAALIYEIVWFQLLQLVIGSSAISIAVLLGTFMGGMCLGSLGLPHVISPASHPLRVYALIEFGIAVCGIAILSGMPYVDRFYAASAGHGVWLRAVVAVICLLPPTVLMGASLPAAARWTEATRGGVSWLGFFYGGNIAGAVLGSLVAGFYLLRVHDVAIATFAAAGINAAVAAAALGASLAARRVAPRRAAQAPPTPVSGSWTVYAAIAISGFCALSAEVIWTRSLSLMLGATVYTFSIILAVFLIGLGIGSGAGSYVGRIVARPRTALGCCQLLAAAAILWATYALARWLPYYPANPSFIAVSWAKFGTDFLRCLQAILPAACLWGASFPLALAAVARTGQDTGGLVGRVYAANTLGAVAGAAGSGLLLIPAAGTQHSQQLLIALSTLAALAALVPFMRRLRSAAALATAAGAVAAVSAWSLPPIPWEVVAHGRQLLAKRATSGTLLYLGEGTNASVAVTELHKTRRFHVSGKVEASSDQQDMRLQRMLGHIPALLHPAPRSVLVVGCGAGVTAGSFVVHPEVKRIVICEIEPLIPRTAARFFDRENHGVLRDPRVEIVYDDARHFIRTTNEKFDIITSDPIHPWVKGSATLYTREYFELCRRHLEPGGIITQWVPLYESTRETVRSEMATFFDVFPDGAVWSNETILGDGYDVVLSGRTSSERIDAQALERRLEAPQGAALKQSLREVGFPSAMAMLSTYTARAGDMRRWLRGAEINRDRSLRLQYMAGLGLESKQAGYIYEEMLYYRTPLDRMFVMPPKPTCPESGRCGSGSSQGRSSGDRASPAAR